MRVCIFCGAYSGIHSVHAENAALIAQILAQRGHTIIYGGGKVGLMGIVADTALQHGAEVIGVIPDFLIAREVGHKGLTEMIVVKSMHERKQKMANLADVFIALSGGWGTLDELAEVLTWKQLGLIKQPIGVLNVEGYYNGLQIQMETMQKNGFLRVENLHSINFAEKPVLLL
ncbi:MAG TPA: TIGR00730 family Rossman fold protein, partial [Cyclobacteriaceae bacterium]|nr:TIGR00730 family Rossman fold protein [Cyclobacteriaceae bacterium]